jgi:hypothetical protein
MGLSSVRETRRELTDFSFSFFVFILFSVNGWVMDVNK